MRSEELLVRGIRLREINSSLLILFPTSHNISTTMHDFKKFATGNHLINSMVLDDVIKSQNQYLNPYILEERQLNVTQMDVFSRLMMDRIIFLGTQIDDYTANTLQAQLLYLDSCDPGKDISIYINSPGGSVYAGLGIYDTMQYINSPVATSDDGPHHFPRHAD